MIWGPATQASSSRASRVDSVLARILLLEVHNLSHAFGSTFGDGRKKRRSMEATETDERGAQLSQECPPPVNLPSGTKVRTAQCRWCGRLFRMGRIWVDSAAAGGIVSRRPVAAWRTTSKPSLQ